MRASVFIATSLDGFIAREDGNLDWLVGGGAAGEDYGYEAFMRDVDAVVMGSGTYEKVLTFGAWPYGGRRVVVLSSRPIAPPPRGAVVEHMRGTARDVAQRLAAAGVTHAYVDGGRTIQQFLAAGLIQRLIVTRVPVLLGRGIALFGPVPGDLALRHVATRAYPSGFVQSEYAAA